MKPGEHKTVQARILEYAEAIGWLRYERMAARRGPCPQPMATMAGLAPRIMIRKAA